MKKYLTNKEKNLPKIKKLMRFNLYIYILLYKNQDNQLEDNISEKLFTNL